MVKLKVFFVTLLLALSVSLWADASQDFQYIKLPVSTLINLKSQISESMMIIKQLKSNSAIQKIQLQDLTSQLLQMQNISNNFKQQLIESQKLVESLKEQLSTMTNSFQDLKSSTQTLQTNLTKLEIQNSILKKSLWVAVPVLCICLIIIAIIAVILGIYSYDSYREFGFAWKL